MRLIGLIQNPGNVITEGGEGFILTSFGIEVKRSGSWTKYQEDKEEEKKASRQLIASSLQTNWLQKWLLIATAAFSFLTICVATADIVIHRKELKVAKEELRLHKVEMEKQNQQVDEQKSSTKIDTLKKVK